MTTSSIARFQAVWDWYQVAVHALDVFEEDIQLNPDRHLAMLGVDAVQSISLNLQSSRDELENFALLSLWALFEEAVNDWFAQRIFWAGSAAELDEMIRGSLLKRIQHWTIVEKIDALKQLLGGDVVRDLHAVRKWRDWVAHRKLNSDARPQVVEFSVVQVLFIDALSNMNAYPSVGAKGLI